MTLENAMSSQALKEKVRQWIAKDPDSETRKELEELLGAESTTELQERFASTLEFGTAGLRGILRAGPNGMNRLVVQHATAGLAAYVQKHVQDACKRGVAIGFDGRHMSRQFAEDAACVCAGMGMCVWLFEQPLPTPLCAFAVKHVGASAGIMITASHNPKKYNGYKVYWEHGAQILPPHDQGISDQIAEATHCPVSWCSLEQGASDGLFHSLGEKTIEAYLSGIQAMGFIASNPERVSIAYSPLHGVGASVAERALEYAGFECVHTVASQREPDGAFPTLEFPNPEEASTMDAVIHLATSTQADLACANDPDADRLAAAVRDVDGTYKMLHGDQIGCLLGAHLIEKAKKNAAVATTVVSSRLLGNIAKKHGIAYYETLTGLKWIAHAARQAHSKGQQFVFGYEEALGYMIGDLVWDKDGISALVAVAAIADQCKAKQQTLLDRLEEIHRSYGLHVTCQKSIALAKQNAADDLSKHLRASSSETMAGQKIKAVYDGLGFLQTKRTCAWSLPRSDVLVYELEQNARVVVRPSGTEPKLKCYYEIQDHVADHETYVAAKTRAQAALDVLAKNHQQELENFLA